MTTNSQASGRNATSHSADESSGSAGDVVPGQLTRTPTFLPQEDASSVVKNFLEKEYHREHYEACARRVKTLCEEHLAGKSVQAGFTSRAKDPARLREKLIYRDKVLKKHYKDSDAILKDVQDLAGVRIVLYMPSKIQRETVRTIVQAVFGKIGPRPDDEVMEKLHEGTDPKEQRSTRMSVYRARHLGYTATHYRVRMRECHQVPNVYTWKPNDFVEIQVMSSLTHSWAEAGHDILYKSMNGVTTVDEERILDALNGLVQSGDIILEQLHELVMARTISRFTNKYKLGVFLGGLEQLTTSDSAFAGEIKEDLDVLQKFLEVQNKNYPDAVRTAIQDLGFPHDADKNLHNIIDKYKGFKPKPSMYIIICLIDHMLSKSLADEVAAVHKTIEAEKGSEDAYRCKVMISAIIWLQKFSLHPKDIGQLIRNCGAMPEEIEIRALEFLLTGPLRQKVLEGDVDDKTQKKIFVDSGIPEMLECAWNWFQSQVKRRVPMSICGLVFRIAKMGVLKDLPAELNQLDRVSLTCR